MLYSIVRGSSEFTPKEPEGSDGLLGFLGLHTFRMEELIVLFLKVRYSTIVINGFKSSLHANFKFRSMLDGTSSHSAINRVQYFFGYVIELDAEQLNSAPETDDENDADNQNGRIEHGLFLCLLVSDTNLNEIQPNVQFMTKMEQRHNVLLLFFLHPLSNPSKVLVCSV